MAPKSIIAWAGEMGNKCLVPILLTVSYILHCAPSLIEWAGNTIGLYGAPTLGYVAAIISFQRIQNRFDAVDSKITDVKVELLAKIDSVEAKLTAKSVRLWRSDKHGQKKHRTILDEGDLEACKANGANGSAVIAAAHKKDLQLFGFDRDTIEALQKGEKVLNFTFAARNIALDADEFKELSLDDIRSYQFGGGIAGIEVTATTKTNESEELHQQSFTGL